MQKNIYVRFKVNIYIFFYFSEINFSKKSVNLFTT